MYLEELQDLVFPEVVIGLSEKLVVAVSDLQRVTHFSVMNEYLLIIFI